MKKRILFLILLIIMLFITAFQPNNFSEIWQKGYVEGYCYDIDFCVKPIPPIAPVPRLQDTNYITIYNRGFVAGLKDNPKQE
jgi:hypothetical protein